MQALADLAFLDPVLKSDVTDRIEEKMRTGTAAMPARGKKLLKPLHDSSANSLEWNQTPL